MLELGEEIEMDDLFEKREKLKKALKRRLKWGAALIAVLGFVAVYFAFSDSMKSFQKAYPLLFTLLGVIPFLFLYPLIIMVAKSDGAYRKQKEEYEILEMDVWLRKYMEERGIRHVRTNMESGIWRTDVVRSGLFENSSVIEEDARYYLEGEILSQKFRTSKVRLGQPVLIYNMLAGNDLTGDFWVINGEEECPCRIAIINHNFVNRIDVEEERNRWFIQKNFLQEFTPANKEFAQQCRCFSDDVDAAGEFLSEELMERLQNYALKHSEKDFYVGFNRKEIFFLDSSEQDETFVKYKMINHKNSITGRRKLKKSFLAISDSEPSETIKEDIEKRYLYTVEIMGMFLSESIMWNESTEAVLSDASMGE